MEDFISLGYVSLVIMQRFQFIIKKEGKQYKEVGGFEKQNVYRNFS